MGLAKGLRSNYYDGLAEVTLEWFEQETHRPIRELLAEHFSAHANECPPYEDKAFSILECEPKLKSRLLLGAEGKPIYGKLRVKDIRDGTADLFGEQPDDFLINIQAQKTTGKGADKMQKKVLILSASPKDRLLGKGACTPPLHPPKSTLRILSYGKISRVDSPRGQLQKFLRVRRCISSSTFSVHSSGSSMTTSL